MKKAGLFFLFVLLALCLHNLRADEYGEYDFIFALVKYQGGGDWYNGVNGARHFLSLVRERTELNIAPREKVISISDNDLFLYPFIYINGHDSIRFTDAEVPRLRAYLQNGGFLFCNDDYGLTEPFLREMKRVFPDREFKLVPFDHPIYHCFYQFNEGLPKIHEHYEGPAQGLGLFYENKLVAFLAYNSDIADGWEKPEVFKDSEQKREDAVKMGINILYHALMY